MRIVILGQEEPVYFSPFFRAIIEARPKDIVCVAIACPRGAGSDNLYALWRLLEPAGFFTHLFVKCMQKLFHGTRFDRRSLEGAAKDHKIDTHFIKDVNDPAFLATLRSYEPDIIINQTELLLKRELLQIPKIGVLNRHASLLPRFRGRVGSFWGHAQEVPEYGVTIHFVNEEIDAGPIIVQKKFDLDPRLSFAKVLETLFKHSVPLMLEALEKLESPKFEPLPNNYRGTSAYRFPTLEQIQNYRETLGRRRNAKTQSRKGRK
jgi:methionyl-tRNA formyltransferase